MQTFDCLSKSAPLLGPHFLEASAGTGKTFAIEHIVARLILSEDPVFSLEQILVVTFTRAATRELKLRIRSNLERIQKALLKEEAVWSYLEPFLGSEKALHRIGDALAIFDQAQIFTIHGFCYRTLQEHAFEAGLGFTIKDQGSSSLDAALSDFFESKLQMSEVCPEQLGIVKKLSAESLIRKIKKGAPIEPSKTFAERLEHFKRALQTREKVELVVLQEQFAHFRGSYKSEKGRFDEQVQALALAFVDPATAFRKLIAEKGSLFEFLAPENRKVKAKEFATEFFEWACRTLYPIVTEAADPKQILQTLHALWRPIAEKVSTKEESFGPDDILRVMRKAIDSPGFKQNVQKKYRAALIDEFQDTDPQQWEIFQSLFLGHTESLYLVGDPKQSIYRFRSADLYTYLQAKESIDSAHHYHLDTNFRSSKQLIGALNQLFDREWLKLPKQQRNLPYLPVRAGLDKRLDLADGKGAVHCFQYIGDDPQLAHRYIASEIVRLKDLVGTLSGFAILVKDRNSAAEVQKELTVAGIPNVAKSQELLSDSLAFEAVWELLESLSEPKELGKAKAVFGGPFGGLPAEELKLIDSSPMVFLRQQLDELGLASFFHLFWKTKLGTKTVQEQIASFGPAFYSECHQVLEALFEWERLEGFSLAGALRFFETMQQMDPDEALVRRRDSDADAVQIMTMHVSKGLEFEIVFALGLGSRTPASDEEVDAEKLRQLYVAMTRAKSRLYIPIPDYRKQASAGTLSPIELFCQTLSADGKWREELERLAEEESLTIETVSAMPAAVYQDAAKPPLLTPPLPLPSYPPSYLLSFTSLAKEAVQEILDPLPAPNGLFTAHNMPRGAETGVAIHAIFERLFGKVKVSHERIVEETVAGTILEPWKEAILKLVKETLALDLLEGLRLVDIDPKKVLVETEFLFSTGKDCIKGFIDLVFEHRGKIYLVDWKTNWLGESSSAYTEERLMASIGLHQYDLQAKLYAEALRRANANFGGAFYLYVRGPRAVCLRGNDG